MHTVSECSPDISEQLNIILSLSLKKKGNLSTPKMRIDHFFLTDHIYMWTSMVLEFNSIEMICNFPLRIC